MTDDGKAVQMLLAQLIVAENGSALNGAITIPKQTLPASVYDKALAAALRLAAKPAEEGRPSRLTDRELYDNSCITRHQLKNWVNSDYAAHVAGLKHTIEFLLTRLDALSPGEPQPSDNSVTDPETIGEIK